MMGLRLLTYILLIGFLVQLSVGIYMHNIALIATAFMYLVLIFVYRMIFRGFL